MRHKPHNIWSLASSSQTLSSSLIASAESWSRMRCCTLGVPRVTVPQYGALPLNAPHGQGGACGKCGALVLLSHPPPFARRKWVAQHER